jgi:hypothetical protein
MRLRTFIAVGLACSLGMYALVIAVGLACSLAVHALAHSSRAAAYDGKYAQLEGPEPCTVGHQFEPGPIVDGHHRQPTPLEFESRMRQLRALTQTNGGSLGGRAC